LKASRGSLVDMMGVVLGLMGLTCIMVGTIAFPIAGAWRNSFSITFLPVGIILLLGSAFIMWRLASVLALPAGIVACAVGVIAWGNALEGASIVQYALPAAAGATLALGSVAVNVVLMLKGNATRKGLVGANVVVMCIIGLVLLGVVNYMASLYYNKRDLTQSGKFTLSGKTIQILENLDEPVKVTVIMPPSGPIYDFTSNMLDDYARFSDGKLSVDYIDIDMAGERERAGRFFEENKGVNNIQSVVFQASGGKTKQIPIGQLVANMDTLAQMQGVKQEPKFNGENEFTAALIKVTDKEKSVIYFTTGKGELLLRPAGSQPAMSRIAKDIKGDNYEIKTINIAAEKRIPDDCTVLAIIGPTRRFSTLELDQIGDFLKVRHGKLLVALEPIGTKVVASGLERILEEWGIRARTDMKAVSIYRPVLGGQQQASFQIFAEHPPHQITKKMQSLSTIFLWSCVVEPLEPPKQPRGQSVPARYDTAPLAMTSKGGWGETDKTAGPETRYNEGIDLTGPVPIAACSQERAPKQQPPSPYDQPPKPDPNFDGARIVVLGDRDVLTNRNASQGPGNVNFVLNIINWLAGKTVRLSIAPKSIYAKPITIKYGEEQAIFYSTLFGLPYLALVIGGIVYWRRSS